MVSSLAFTNSSSSYAIVAGVRIDPIRSSGSAASKSSASLIAFLLLAVFGGDGDVDDSGIAVLLQKAYWRVL